MKNAIRLSSLLIMIVVLAVGCKPPYESAGTANLTEIRERVENRQKKVDYTPEQSKVLDVLTPQSETDFNIYPAVVMVQEMKPDRIVDTWQDDDPNELFIEGDPSGVIISNNTDKEMPIDLTVVLETKGYCELTGTKGYVRPPNYVKNWIIIGEEAVILQPKEVRVVPVAIAIPQGAEVFAPAWEFKIAVHRQSDTFLQDVQMQRWLIHMDGYTVERIE